MQNQVHASRRLQNLLRLPRSRPRRTLCAARGQRHLAHHGDGARFHLVFHGDSGSTEAEIHETLDYGVVKMNVDTDMQYAFTCAVAGHMFKSYSGVLKVGGEVGNKKAYDPREYLALAASQQAITASPVSAATAAMVGPLATHGYGLVQILIICVPFTLLAVLVPSRARSGRRQ